MFLLFDNFLTRYYCLTRCFPQETRLYWLARPEVSLVLIFSFFLIFCNFSMFSVRCELVECLATTERQWRGVLYWQPRSRCGLGSGERGTIWPVLAWLWQSLSSHITHTQSYLSFLGLSASSGFLHPQHNRQYLYRQGYRWQWHHTPASTTTLTQQGLSVWNIQIYI